MASVLRDLRIAARRLRAAPAFTAVAVLTLTFGIGATAAIFTVVEDVLLRPLPFAHPERLVRVTAAFRRLGVDDGGLSPKELFDYRDRAGVFDEIAGVWPITANLTGTSQPERVETLLASPNYFRDPRCTSTAWAAVRSRRLPTGYRSRRCHQRRIVAARALAPIRRRSVARCGSIWTSTRSSASPSAISVIPR